MAQQFLHDLHILVAFDRGKGRASIVIYSEWEIAAAIEAMRADPAMKAYLPKIGELASLDSITGALVWSETR